MKLPGTILRKEREKQKRSLSEIARSLNINIKYLKSIEENSYDLIPAEVFTRAYLRLYADKLGLDSDEILRLYKPEDEAETETEESPVETEIASDIRKRFFKPVLITLFIIAFSVSGIFFITTGKDDPPVQSDIQSTPPESGAEKKPDLLSLKITASELTWVSVTLDDGLPKEWLLHGGDEINVNAKEMFKLKIGNAGGTRLIFNGEDLGSLGPPGKIVDLTLDKSYTLPAKE